MKNVFFALAAITLLAGCDAAKEAMEQVAIE